MKRIKYIVFLFAMFSFFPGCKDKAQEADNQDSKQDFTLTVSREQFQAGEMMLGQIERKPFPEVIIATGIIDVPPQNKAVVGAFMGGYISRTPLLVGDDVRKGQVLLSLENPEFVTLQQNYLEAKQQLSFLEADYERQKQLVAENISSQKNYLKAESDYKGKLALYNGLRQKLSMLNISIEEVEAGNITSVSNIYAPISGSVTKMNVTKGMYVSPSDEIMEVTDNDHIHLELQVFEKDIMKLEKGQLIEFKIPEASEETFEAEVYLIGTHIEENRTVKVHAHLKQERRFLTGMFVQARIIASEVLKMALPNEALVEIDDTAFALQLVSEDTENYVFEKVRVESGQSYEGFKAIEGSDTEDNNAKFLVRGAFSLLTN